MTDVGNLVTGLIKEQKKLRIKKNAFWVDVMGEEIAEESRVKMFREKSGQLIISCADSCVRSELHRRKDEILEKVNICLKKEGKIVKYIIFR